jgi:hypothetical protein
VRPLRLLLVLVAFVAVVLWLVAALHGFKGSYCADDQSTCPSASWELPAGVVLWASPLAVVVAFALLRVTGRRMR